MKTKVIVIIAMLAATTGARGQYGSEYYHRTGDTVYNKSVIGFYNWWDFDQLIQNRDLVIPKDDFTGNPVMALQYFTVDTLKIVGIAGCPRSTWSIYELDTTTVQEYFYLFDNDNGNLVYKDRLGWDLRDPHRTLVMPTNNPGAANIDSCCSSSFLGTAAFPLYEYYFDSAITVTDTFYIGWSFASHFTDNPDATRTRYQALGDSRKNKEACDSLDLGRGNHEIIYDGEQPRWEIFGSCAAIPVTWYKACTDPAINTYPQGSYNWIEYPYLARDIILSYPLIYIDTTVPPAYMCDPVQNFSVTVLDTGSCCVFFTWDDFYHYSSCEVQYYSIEQGYNHAVTTTVTGNNMLHLCGFDSTLTYYARMRAICDTSKTETEWTSWVNFTFPHTNPPHGIDAVPSKLDRYTHLMPNPAADKVTVTSELGLRRIEVYNARGILVYSEPAGYSATTIDLHGWPAGQYLMTIETLQGKTAKRLVVAK